ncbi:MAG: DUF1207 domain-containing protein [Planctomycetaceae bacterium]|nr:DUF1207 domain-containing protein [Planctomycetaceae bacterium]
MFNILSAFTFFLSVEKSIAAGINDTPNDKSYPRLVYACNNLQPETSCCQQSGAAASFDNTGVVASSVVLSDAVNLSGIGNNNEPAANQNQLTNVPPLETSAVQPASFNPLSDLPPLRLDMDSAPSFYPIVPIDSLQLDNSQSSTDTNIFCDNSLESRAQLRPWVIQLLPAGRIYQSYLAGVNETRLGLTWNYDQKLKNIWDATVGGNAPLFRYGSRDNIFAEGFQIDVEGSAHLRMDYDRQRDMDAMDYRFSLPITFGNKIWQIRTGYFHVSSHLGDERMIRLNAANLPHKRINYVRESIVLGISYRVKPSMRVYFEIDYSTWLGELTRPWHFQFGAEYSSPYPVANLSCSPFAAVNVQLLQERSYDGNITIQAGLQWRNNNGNLFRIGLQYFRGISEQFEHMYEARENKFGLGIWYDF